MGEIYAGLDDEDLMRCALDTVLARLRAGDREVETAWQQAVADRSAIRSLEDDLSLSEPQP